MFVLRVLITVFLLAVSHNSIGQQTTAHTEEEATQMIDSIYFKLSKGVDFRTLVSKYSEDPGSNKNGGTYANVEFGSFVPEFEAVVLRLNPNEISTPFKTEYGFHIVQVLSKSAATFTARQIMIRCCQ